MGKGDPLGFFSFFNIHYVAKYQKTGESLTTLKILEKSLTVSKKLKGWTVQSHPILQLHEKVSG